MEAEGEQRRQNTIRFLRIVRRLPIELQMVVCLHMFNISSKDIISASCRDLAFKKMALVYAATS